MKKSRRAFHFLPHDLAILPACILFSVLSFFCAAPGDPLVLPGLGSWHALAVGFALCFALILVLTRLDMERAPALLKFVRTFYPQLFLYPFFMVSIGLSVHLAVGGSRDALFASLDQSIFGFQPAVEFPRHFGSVPWFCELMFIGYIPCFYCLLAVVPWIPWFLGRREEACRQVFIQTLAMVVVFSFYIFFRVEGPKYWLAEFRGAGYNQYAKGFFSQIYIKNAANMDLSGAAFPSSHILFSILAVMFTARIDKRLLAISVPVTVLICFSTIFNGAHYAIDVVGGLVAGLLLWPIFLRVHEPAARLADRFNSRKSMIVPQTQTDM